MKFFNKLHAKLDAPEYVIMKAQNAMLCIMNMTSIITKSEILMILETINKNV